MTSNATAEFAGTADKWRTLLALPSTATVVLAGAAYEAIADDFRRVFSRVVLANSEGAEGRESYDLLLADVRRGTRFDKFFGRAATQPSSQPVVARLRELSLFERLGLQSPRSESGAVALVTTENQRVPVEYWKPDSHHPERPRKGYRYVLELSNPSASDPLACLRLPDELKGVVKERVGEQIEIENIRFRRRGSVLLSIRGPRGALILRISGAGQNRARLLRNREALLRIHDEMRLPRAIAARIPESVASLEVGDFAYDIETELPGLPLWRLRPGSPERKNAAASAVRFATEFESVVVEEAMLVGQRYDAIVGASIARVRADLAAFSASQEVLSKLDQQLRRRFQGRPQQLAVGHGDYTPGNVLVDSRTGDLLAVVDWDTYHPLELQGADRWHFVLQEALATSGGVVAQAQRELERLSGLDAELTLFAAVRMHERALEFGQEGIAARAPHAAIIECMGGLLARESGR